MKNKNCRKSTGKYIRAINRFINSWLLKLKLKKWKTRPCFTRIAEYLFLSIVMFVHWKKKIENTLFPQMFTCILRYFSYFWTSVYLTNVEKRWIMTGHYCLCRITNIKASSQAYKKVALRNSCNFWHKVMKKFIYLYDLMIKSAKRKLWLWLLSANICL